MNHIEYRNQVCDLSAQYERLTGKQGLLYVSRPGDGQARYVFGDAVKIGGREALAHITQLLDAAQPAGKRR